MCCKVASGWTSVLLVFTVTVWQGWGQGQQGSGPADLAPLSLTYLPPPGSGRPEGVGPPGWGDGLAPPVSNELTDLVTPSTPPLPPSVPVKEEEEEEVECEDGPDLLNSTVRVLPYQIPVPGQDWPDDGCPRSEVRVNGECQVVLERGSCQPGQWVLVDRTTRQGQCSIQLCEDGYAFLVTDGLCHDIYEPGLCPGNRRVFVTAFGEPVCDCPDVWYPDLCEVCQLLFSRSPCRYNQQLMFDANYRLRCVSAVCPPEKPVPFNDTCGQWGEGCDESGSTVRLDVLAAGPVCTDPEAAESVQRPQILTPPQTMMPPGSMYWAPPASELTRTARQITKAAPLLTKCAPGAKVDQNFKCRSIVDVESPGSGARKPTRPRISCPPGQVLDFTGQCKSAGGSLG